MNAIPKQQQLAALYVFTNGLERSPRLQRADASALTIACNVHQWQKCAITISMKESCEARTSAKNNQIGPLHS
jgi:hypothetical protein